MRTSKIFKKNNCIAIQLLIIAVSIVISGCESSEADSPMVDFPETTTDELVPLHFFVRTHDGEEIDPATIDPTICLITDLGRKTLIKPDGSRITWAEWSKVKGQLDVACTEDGTKITLRLTGLIPNGVYTVWNVTFKAPGFTGEFDGPGLPSNVKAFGPVGINDGSESKFVASASGEGTITAITPPGALGTVGEIGACALIDELEWHVVGLYHSDGNTHGPERGPDGTHAEQFAFIFKNDG